MGEKRRDKAERANAPSPEEAAARMGALRRLNQAVDRGDVEAARSALADGADPNGRLYGDSEMPPLLRCVVDQKVGVMELLLKAGADPNAFDRDANSGAAGHGRRSALRLACESVSETGIQIVASLLSHGAKPDGVDGEPAQDRASVYAVERNRKKALREMVLAGYDFRSPISTPYDVSGGRSLLERAEGEKKFELMEIMLAAEAELEGREIESAMEPGQARGGEARRPRV